MNLENFIRADYGRYTNIKYSRSNTFKLLLHSQGFKYMFFKRIKDNRKRGLLKYIAIYFLKRYTYKYGFQIGGEIGPGFYIGHFGTIVVSVSAKLGSNCNIAHNVTIGTTRGKNKGVPSIGDFVWIGTGAVIVGNITIGDNVLIAPNSYINCNVPSNTMVIGNPCKLITKDNPTKNYINNVWINEQ